MSKLVAFAIIFLHLTILSLCQQNLTDTDVTKFKHNGTHESQYNFTNSLTKFRLMLESQLEKVDEEISSTYLKLKNVYNRDIILTNEIESKFIIFVCK